MIFSAGQCAGKSSSIHLIYTPEKMSWWNSKGPPKSAIQPKPRLLSPHTQQSGHSVLKGLEWRAVLTPAILSSNLYCKGVHQKCKCNSGNKDQMFLLTGIFISMTGPYWEGPHILLLRRDGSAPAERKLSCLEVWNLPAPTFLLTRAVLSWEGFPNSNPEIYRVVGRRTLASHTEAHDNLWLTHIKGIFCLSPGSWR